MKLLLLAGAGTSVELGVPAMVGLAEEFIDHAKQWRVEPDLVRQLLGNTLDIEHLIERLDQICSARDPLQSIGQDPEILSRADTIRAEVEWFVQHAAERVISREAQLLWGPLLRATREMELTIATTNYDRAIELAANADGISIEDGYGSFGATDTAEWQGFSKGHSNILLVKLHGSTDWYLENEQGSPKKLRHPMPLFGRSTLKMPTGLELGSALILPSREKLLTRQPYPRLSQAFLNAADECNFAIVIGSSLRDHHLRAAVESIAERAPVFLVNPEGSNLNLDRATGISQTASAFLTGRLPVAIRCRDPIRTLHDAAKAPLTQPINCLHPLAAALDTEADEATRCAALDQLESAGIVIDSEWLRTLIQGTSSEVARYSLGFLVQTPDSETLLDLARSCPHAANGSAFHEDVALLESMLSQKPGTETRNRKPGNRETGDSHLWEIWETGDSHLLKR